MIVKIVSPVIGTVAAAPVSELPLKLPSELDSVHETTPFADQYTEVREPRETALGTAQMVTCGGI